MTLWEPPANTCLVFDTSVLIEITNPTKPFHQQTIQALHTIICKRKPTLIIPSIAEYQLYQWLPNIDMFNTTTQKLHDTGLSFELMNIYPEACRLAILLSCLFRWEYDQKLSKGQVAKLETIDRADFLIGAFASVHEDKAGKNTYVVTFDQHFGLIDGKYFRKTSKDYIVENGRSTKRLYVYRPLTHAIYKNFMDYQKKWEIAHAKK